jgi:hypothetical protein
MLSPPKNMSGGQDEHPFENDQLDRMKGRYSINMSRIPANNKVVNVPLRRV